MATSLRGTAAGQVLRALAIVGAGIGLVYSIQFIEFASVMFEVFDSINSESDAAKNQHGDELYIRTDISDRLQDPVRTVVRLRRAHHWFSTTLLEANSFGVAENMKWVNDNNLEVSLGFGCLVRMTHPVERVSPIHITYRFSDGDKSLSKGCPD
jgi:hypothetical protein